MLVSKHHYDLAMTRGSGQVTPVNGKSSVSSELFSNNYVALIDRLKDILTKKESDQEKVRQLRMLLNVQPPTGDLDAEIKELITDEKATIEEFETVQSPKQLKF